MRILLLFLSAALIYLPTHGIPARKWSDGLLGQPRITQRGEEDIIHGWRSSPDTRGTGDILWSCLLTIFLCTWTSICVNVPPLKSTTRGQLARKLLVFFEALCGPEFIFHTALGQYKAAKRSIQDFADIGHLGWTLRHGFFADMGGFVLHPTDFVPFPINVNQLHYLVAHGYIDYSTVHLSLGEINDRNKFDGMSRLLSFSQLLWTTVNIIARAVNGFYITTLEITTIAFVFCSLCTYVVWREKPSGVTEPIRIVPNATMANILIKAGPIAAKPYRLTPMDFADRRPHWFGVAWDWTMRVGSACGVDFHDTKRPVDKVWDDEFAELGLSGNLVLALIQFSFAGIHLAAWNFRFPTACEKALWHIATVYLVISMVLTWSLLGYSFEVHPKVLKWWTGTRKGDKEGPSSSSELNEKKSTHSRWSRYEKPHWIAMLCFPLGGLYIYARAYIFLEDLINLRELPASAYEAVDWSSLIPHL